MQTNWILLVALIAVSSAYKVRPKVTSPAPIPTPEPPALQNVPNLWMLELHKEPGDSNTYKVDGRVIIDHGKNYAIFDGKRFPIKLEPVGNNDVIDDTVNKNVDIRLNAPLAPSYAVDKDVTETGDNYGMIKTVEEYTSQFLPSQSLVYTSRTSNFGDLPLWAIDYNKKVKVIITNNNIFQFLFSIRKISD